MSTARQVGRSVLKTKDNDVRAEMRRVAWVTRQGVRTMDDHRTQLSAFSSIRLPSLLMTGERSPLTARRVTDRLESEIPGASSQVVPEAGHLGPVTHARDVNGRIFTALGLTASQARKDS